MVVLAVVALSAWALSSPVGSSPDDDYHLASIWCSATAGGCERHGDTVTVPAWTVKAPSCFAFHPEVPASCQNAAALAGTADVRAARANLTGSYPPGFYLALGLLAGPDVPTSVYAMRIADAILLVLVFALALGLAPPAVRQSGLLALLAVGGPLGWFLFASTNPSAWAVCGCAALAISLLGFLLHEDDGRAMRMLAPAALALLLCLGSRADAAGYAAVVVVGMTCASLLRRETPRRRRSILLGASIALALAGGVALLAFGQASIGLGGGGAATSNPLGVDLRNVIDLPYLLLGSIGFWGLGWLDTRMPIGVPILAALMLGGVLMLGFGRVPRWAQPGIALVAVALVALPLRVLHTRGYGVGEFVQPRYMLPLLLAGVVLVLAPSAPSSMLRLTRLQLSGIVVTVLAVFAVGLLVNAQRYATGLADARFDVSSHATWWSVSWLTPNQTVAIGILACAGFLALAWRHLRAD